MSDAPLDALAVGPHPDDVELFCGGTLVRLVQLGHRVGVVDLTEGELASNGSVEVRREEASAAAKLMGLVTRQNLKLPDAGISPGTDPEQVRAVVRALRRLQPELLIVPWIEARHPDHAAAGHLMRRAAFLSGLRRFDPDGGPPFRPQTVLFYQNRFRFTPSFIVDISRAVETKTRAILCHRSQVAPGPEAEPTLVGNPQSLAVIEARDRYYGGFIGTEYGEPFRVEATMGIVDPIRHFRDNAFGRAFAFEALS